MDLRKQPTDPNGGGFASLSQAYGRGSVVIAIRVFILILLSSALTVACVKGQSHHTPSPARGDVAEAFNLDGSSSGAGGGYSDENGRQILERVRLELLALAKTADWARMKTVFPKSWDLDLVIPILEKRFLFEPSKTVSRDGVDLIFDYGKDDEGPYIVALRPLFIALITVVEDTTKNDWNPASDRNFQTVEDLKIKVLHEICHHFGVGQTKETDPEARECGHRLMSGMKNVFSPEAFGEINRQNISFLKPRKEGDSLVITFSEDIFENCINQLIANARTKNLDLSDVNECVLAKIGDDLMPTISKTGIPGKLAKDYKELDQYRSENGLNNLTNVWNLPKGAVANDRVSFWTKLNLDGTIIVGIDDIPAWTEDPLRRVLGAMVGEIRFFANRSADGGTYVVIPRRQLSESCDDSMQLDGKPWTVKWDNPMPISPGFHKYGCFNGKQEMLSGSFTIEPGEIKRLE